MTKHLPELRRCAPDTSATPQQTPESLTTQGLESCVPPATNTATVQDNSNPDNGELRSCVYIGNATPQQSSKERNRKRNTQRNSLTKSLSLREVIRNRKRNLTATPSCARQPEDPAQQAANRFVRLVNSFAVCRGFLLDRKQILAELDAKDLDYLLTTPKEERQVWAELLADRLCRERLEGN